MPAFVRNKHLKWVNPYISFNVYPHAEKEVLIELFSQNLARFVELSLKDTDVVFRDNYFDLLPGEVVPIISPLPEGWTVKDFSQSLSVFSLYVSFFVG